MRGYQRTEGCRLQYLREQLDDVGAAPCGRCDRCTGDGPELVVEDAAIDDATRFFRSAQVPIEPRKQWPRSFEGRKGNVAPDRRAEEGRALAFGTDPGWSEVLAPLFAQPDGPPSEELVRGVAAVLKAWPWGRRPTWVTWVPSRTRPLLVQGLAARIAELGSMELVEAVVRIRADAPQGPHRLGREGA